MTGRHHLHPPRMTRDRLQAWILGITVALLLLALITGSLAVWVLAFLGALAFTVVIQ